MGGLFGAISKEDCIFDIFYGTDYHSHLGTRRGGIAVYDAAKGFDHAIHNIESTPFRAKFGYDVDKMTGTSGIGCISDFEPQPIIVRSHHGTYAITTVGRINNIDEITGKLYAEGFSHFQEMSTGDLNPTEVTAALINQKGTLVDGIKYAQETIDGSITLLLLTKGGIYAARDLLGRTPMILGKKDTGFCACMESFSFIKLGYNAYKELGPGEIDYITADGVEVLERAHDKMRICSFLWIYYGFPASTYEGLNVEVVRYNCGRKLASHDSGRKDVNPDSVAPIPDSGTAHAMGYSYESGIPCQRPFVKYSPTWARSFMPTTQSRRNFIAGMKLIPIHELIEGKKLLLIDDSIVRGTQLRETTEFLYASGAKEVHIRPACPPLVYGCRYLNFSRSGSDMELITRQAICRLEGRGHLTEDILQKYVDPDSAEYAAMLEEIRRRLNFTSLHFHRLDDMIESIGLDPCWLCTYCWNGKE